MRDNPQARAMQGRGNSNQAIFTAYQTRAEDPTDPTDLREKLNALAAAVIRDAKELETAIMTTDDAPRAIENKRAAQKLDKLDGSRNIVQNKPQSKRASKNNIWATLQLWLTRAVAIGTLTVAWFLMLGLLQLELFHLQFFQSQLLHFKLTVGALVFLSFLSGLLFGRTY